MTSEMLLPSLFCLVLVVLHVEETIGKYLRAVGFLCYCSPAPCAVPNLPAVPLTQVCVLISLSSLSDLLYPGS